MNYQVITDEALLNEFIQSFLKPCSPDETYYCCLFARSKYAKNEDGSNKFPHIKTDKAQLRRFLATPDTLLNKIKQLEVPFGAYITKDGEPVPQEALALYITPNKRSQRKAMFKLIKRLLDIQECEGKGFNVNAEAISVIQRSKSKTDWVDFDIDSKDVDLNELKNILPLGSYKILETRGGYHIMVDPEKIDKTNAPRQWYNMISQKFTVDQTGDNMIPVVGTHQGGFTPKFIEL